MLDKKIKLLNTIDELAVGDVVLFRSVYHKNLPQRLIGYYQSLTSYKHGHYDTVHAGICVGHNVKGPVIAHVTGGKYFSYAKQALVDTNLEDQENRSLVVYRHKDQTIREVIAAKAAAIDNELKKPKWTFSSAVKLLFTNTQQDTPADAISASTICSKFTIEILKQATKNSGAYLKMHANSSPKALEAELFNNPHYDLYIHTGHPDATSKQGLDPYLTLKTTVENELNRLGQQQDNKYVEKKYLEVKAALFRNVQFAETESDALTKAQHLLNEVMPALQINTGYGFSTPTSYKNVAEQARKLGLFRWQAPAPATPTKVEIDNPTFKYRMLTR